VGGEPEDNAEDVIEADEADLYDGDEQPDEDEPRLPVLVDPSGPPVPAPLGGASGALEAGDTLTRYMNQLRVYPPISREEEQLLARRWVEQGDVDAARRLVVSNLRLVVKIAMEYRRAWTNALDLIQEGNVGLMEAVQRFDPYQGVKLSTYAVYWIRAYILKYILDNMRSVRLGTTRAQRKLFYRLNKERRELERQGYEVTPKLIAERLDVTEQDVVDMQQRLSRPDLSTDAPVREDDGSATYGDFLTGDAASAEERVGEDELRAVFLEQIAAFKEQLEPRDLQILEERVLAEEPRTLADMGEEFGVTRERVRQLEARLVSRLRDYMKAHLVDFEYYAPDRTG
jgi:RNA polymerase sigma-32 factor